MERASSRPAAVCRTLCLLGAALGAFVTADAAELTAVFVRLDTAELPGVSLLPGGPESFDPRQSGLIFWSDRGHSQYRTSGQQLNRPTPDTLAAISRADAAAPANLPGGVGMLYTFPLSPLRPQPILRGRGLLTPPANGRLLG
ncbi:MAG: hypothetical protein WCF18_19360, partial [Chthoniobacteraceae bacterium]